VKALFLPVSILGGVVAGIVSKKLFALIWGVIDDQEPPNAKHRVEDHRKLVAALVLEGAIFRLVRGGVDHVSRHGFARLAGSWPGEEEPQPQ
jgi:Protein of unknown function (DUF4235)